MDMPGYKDVCWLWLGILYPSSSQRILAHGQYVEGLDSKIRRNFALFYRISMARGALLDNYFGKCSYYRSQHARLLL